MTWYARRYAENVCNGLLQVATIELSVYEASASIMILCRQLFQTLRRRGAYFAQSFHQGSYCKISPWWFSLAVGHMPAYILQLLISFIDGVTSVWFVLLRLFSIMRHPRHIACDSRITLHLSLACKQADHNLFRIYIETSSLSSMFD